MNKALTTAEHVQEAVNPWEPVSFGAETIAAELDAKDAEIVRLAAEVAALSADAKAWRTLRRYERLLIAGFCSYADLNAAKAEAQQAAQEATT